MKNVCILTIGDLGGDGHERTKDVIIKSNKTPSDIRSAHALFVQKYGVGFYYVTGSPNDTIIFCDEYEERLYNPKGIAKLIEIDFPYIDKNPKTKVYVSDYPVESMYLEMAKFVMPDFEYEFIELETINRTNIGYGAIG